MNTQSQSFGNNVGAPNLEMFGKKLHEIGDKIERIAEKLKADGKSAEGEELYQLGDEVEHFFEQVQAGSIAKDVNETPSTWSAPGADTSKEQTPSSAQKDSSSTVNNAQSSG